MIFFGREKEIEELNSLVKSYSKMKKGLLIGIDGIRRVGKTTLVHNYITNKQKDNEIYFKFIGNSELSSEENLKEVLNKTKDTLKDFYIKNNINNKTLNISKIKTWSHYFDYLKENIELLRKNNVKIFIFFDEISWYSKQNKFLPYFSNYWNQHGCFTQDLVVFMATSVSSWSEKVFGNSDGLFNRFSRIIKLKPFSLEEIKQFLKLIKPTISEKEIVYYYMIFGGVIQYYQWIDGNFEQTLSKLVNNSEQLLLEKNRLFKGIFSENKNHKEILNILCSSKSLTFSEILKKMKNEYKYNKTESYLYEQLKELEDHDFIISSKFGTNKYFSIYNSYCLFVNYWIENNRIHLLQNLDQHFSTWKGQAFELLIMKNIDLVCKILNLKNIPNYQFNWRYCEDGKQLAQIDILLDITNEFKRLDKTKYLVIVECKNYGGYLKISTIKELNKKRQYLEYSEELRKNKINIEGLLITLNPVSEEELDFPMKYYSILK